MSVQINKNLSSPPTNSVRPAVTLWSVCIEVVRVHHTNQVSWACLPLPALLGTGLRGLSTPGVPDASLGSSWIRILH